MGRKRTSHYAGGPRFSSGGRPAKIQTVEDAYRDGQGWGDYTGISEPGWPRTAEFEHPDKYVKAWMEGYRDAERRRHDQHERSYHNPGPGRRSNPYLTVGRRKVWVARYGGGTSFRTSRSAWPGRQNPRVLHVRGRSVQVHAYKGGGLFKPYERYWPHEDAVRARSSQQARRLMRAHGYEYTNPRRRNPTTKLPKYASLGRLQELNLHQHPDADRIATKGGRGWDSEYQIKVFTHRKVLIETLRMQGRSAPDAGPHWRPVVPLGPGEH